MSERWTADHVPVEAYDRLREQLQRAEGLLREIGDGKHSIPGCLVQIDRYFDSRGKPETLIRRGPRRRSITSYDNRIPTQQTRQILMHGEELVPAFEQWLEGRGLSLVCVGTFREDDLPSWVIQPRDATGQVKRDVQPRPKGGKR